MWRLCNTHPWVLGEKIMHKDKIIEFAQKQIITVVEQNIEDNKSMTVKKYCDLSKYFKEEDTVEFYDSTKAYLSIDFEKDNILTLLKKLKLKVIKDGEEVKIEDLPFPAISLLSKAISSFLLSMS